MKRKIDRIESSADDMTIVCKYECSKGDFTDVLIEAATLSKNIRSYPKNPIMDIIYVYAYVSFKPSNFETTLKTIKNIGFDFQG